MKKATNKKAFTLVELLVVVAIIAILMLLAIPKFMNSTKVAKVRTFESNARTLISLVSLEVLQNSGNTDDPNFWTNINKKVNKFNGKPKGSSYYIEDGALIARLKAKEFGSKAKQSYTIKYDLKTEEITQKGTIPPSATDLSTR